MITEAIAQQLRQHLDDLVHSAGETLLHLAAAKNWVPGVELLVSMRADPAVRNSK